MLTIILVPIWLVSQINPILWNWSNFDPVDPELFPAPTADRKIADGATHHLLVLQGVMDPALFSMELPSTGRQYQRDRKKNPLLTCVWLQVT